MAKIFVTYESETQREQASLALFHDPGSNLYLFLAAISGALAMFSLR